MDLGDKGMGKWVPYMIHMKVMCVSSHGGLQFPSVLVDHWGSLFRKSCECVHVAM